MHCSSPETSSSLSDLFYDDDFTPSRGTMLAGQFGPFSETHNESYYFSCLQCGGQLSVHLRSSVQTAILEKMVLNVPEHVRIWIYPVSVLPASLAAYALLAQ